jgi:predicted transcriptional regulator
MKLPMALSDESLKQLKQEILLRWQEVQSGKVVSHATVMAWLMTWGTEQEKNRPSYGS